MIEPPEFTSQEAIDDFIAVSKEVTGIVPIEMKRAWGVQTASVWLAGHWHIYYTPEQQQAMAEAFVIRRLTK